MAFQQVDVLEVHAWGRRVGALAASPTSRAYAFRYDPAWRGGELSPILMPLSPRGRTWVFPNLPEETFHLLPPLIADSAPDRFGNAIITAALGREGIAPAQLRPIDRLAYVGERAMGALTFHPSQAPSHLPTGFEIASLVESARAALQGTLDDDGRTESLQQLIAVGTSAGGARAKAVIAWDPGTGEVRAGGLASPPGFEQWLLKFDGVGEDLQLGVGGDYGRTEYAYSLMARAAGIEMTECRLLHEGGRAHFMTRRFDRPGSDGERVHMQTLCALQALDYNAVDTHDYASLFLTAEQLGVQAEDQLFRRMCFNVLAANNDDHTKNHAFIRAEGGDWELAPAYDLTYAYAKGHRWLDRHLMSVNGRFAGITRRDLLSVADQFMVPGAKRVLAEVAEAVAGWPEAAREAGVGAERTRLVAARLAEIAEETA
ncbi:MAG: type II toxin-antitoxin system HipA family toxin [Leucobacter sp.]